MDVKAISLNVGKALLVSALFMFLSIIVSIVDGRDAAFGPLLISFLITFIVGAFPFIFVRGRRTLSQKGGILTIVFAWLLSFIFGMLPYVLYGGEFTLINAWFESVSGFTTTGSTILNNVESLPKSLIFWRSSTHFIGGLGVVVFLLLVMPDASPYRLRLTNMEMSSLSKSGYKYKSSKVVRIITGVYFSLTIAATLSLWAAGMSFFDALNHAFSVVATGGFSTRNLSIAAYDSTVINLIITFFMAVCAMHFGLLYSVVVTRSFKPLNNTVVRYYFISMIVMSLFAMLSLVKNGNYDSWGESFMNSLFTVVSYMSTTGFGLCDNSDWPVLACLMLMVAAFQCGCAGSTTGGVKVDRIVISIKAISNEIKHRLHPTSISNTRLSGQHLADSAVHDVVMYLVVYCVVTIASIILLLLCGFDTVEAISSVISSIGNCGPGLGEVGSMDNYSAMQVIPKLIYTIDMFLGRVEIYPLLVAVAMIFNREK